MEISELVKIRSMGYYLEDVKVNFRHDLKIDAPEISIDAKHGDILSVPRWAADVLHSEKLVDIQDIDMLETLKQTIPREDNQGQFSLSTLDEDFYIKLNDYMKRLPEKDCEKVESMLNSLLRKREGKIISLSNSYKMTAELIKKLTIEEKALFDYIHYRSSEFKKQIVGGQK